MVVFLCRALVIHHRGWIVHRLPTDCAQEVPRSTARRRALAAEAGPARGASRGLLLRLRLQQVPFRVLDPIHIQISIAIVVGKPDSKGGELNDARWAVRSSLFRDLLGCRFWWSSPRLKAEDSGQFDLESRDCRRLDGVLRPVRLRAPVLPSGRDRGSRFRGRRSQ